MKHTKTVTDTLKIVPKLQLGIKLDGGGVKSTGPHRVRFISDSIVEGVDPETGKPRKEMKYLVEEDGITKRWHVPIRDKQGNPNYLLERLMGIEEGDEAILEMKRKGIKNYVTVQKVVSEDHDGGTINLDEDDEGSSGEPGAGVPDEQPEPGTP